jgi:hypothetical protein
MDEMMGDIPREYPVNGPVILVLAARLQNIIGYRLLSSA